ncbi:hypothetical protein [Clostridium sp. VAP23]|uniref:hypothetical protein n=1 Tax=Clostridium sp. VAP23 TaxID=2949981 RepID=UPI002079EC2B|nr:hypothetical protein [Clostridium sp. VAP23]
MNKNLVKLVAAVTIVTTTIGSNLVKVNASEKDNLKEDVKVEQIQKIKSEKTTAPAVDIEVSDISKVMLEKYDDYFKSNEDVKNIDDLINKVYACLDDIDVESNPNFSYLEKGKIEYKILCDIKEEMSKDNKKFKNIEDTIAIYEVYAELSKDGGFLLHINSGGEPYEKIEQASDILENFLTKYDYKNVNEEKFKTDLATTLTLKLGDKFDVEYIDDETSKFISPTIDSTGYVYVDAYLLVNKDRIKFSYETVLNKLKNSSSSNNNSSGGGSSHKGGSGGGSSHKNKTDKEDKITNDNENKNNEVNNESKNVNLVVKDNITKLVDTDGKALTGWQQVDGKWYLADTTGQVLTGWQQVDGKWYLMHENGTMQNGWYKDATGKWYLLQESGAMQRGWYKDTNGEWYLLQESGSMKNGWYKDTNGKWYLLQENGSMKKGWYKDTNGTWYYLNSDGSMAHDTYINGYYVDSNGAWV